MKRIVFRFGLASGAILIAMPAVMMPLCMNGTIDFANSELLGYSAMVLSFLLVFFGVRSYRDTVAGGEIGFGRAFKVGILITLVTCAIYVIAWQIAYFNFFPDFLDQYSAHVLEEDAGGWRRRGRDPEDDGADGLHGEVLRQPPLQLRHHLPGGLPGRAHRDPGLRRDPAPEAPAGRAGGRDGLRGSSTPARPAFGRSGFTIDADSSRAGVFKDDAVLVSGKCGLADVIARSITPERAKGRADRGLPLDSGEGCRYTAGAQPAKRLRRSGRLEGRS